MSQALPGTHLCKEHQGNHSHYASENCELCQAKAEIERLKTDRERGWRDYCALMDRHDEQHNEIEKLREAVKAGAKMIRWIADHKDRMHAVAWLDALETAEMMEAALAGKPRD